MDDGRRGLYHSKLSDNATGITFGQAHEIKLLRARANHWGLRSIGPRTVSYSICPNFESLWREFRVNDKYIFML